MLLLSFIHNKTSWTNSTDNGAVKLWSYTINYDWNTCYRAKPNLALLIQKYQHFLLDGLYCTKIKSSLSSPGDSVVLELFVSEIPSLVHIKALNTIAYRHLFISSSSAHQSLLVVSAIPPDKP